MKRRKEGNKEGILWIVGFRRRFCVVERVWESVGMYVFVRDSGLLKIFSMFILLLFVFLNMGFDLIVYIYIYNFSFICIYW